MAIKRTFNGATIIKPGAYSAVKVQSLTGFPLQPTGIVGIIGEAVGGEPRVLDVISGSQFQSAKDRYKAGPIADAIGILAEPSKDSRVPNGASTIVIYKTNNSTRSALELNSNLSTVIAELQSRNWGADENNLNAVIAEGSITDKQATVEGTIDGDFTVANGETLIVDVLGTDYTFTNTLVGAQTATAVMGELNTDARWAPSRPVEASLNGAKINLAVRDTVAKLDYSYMVIDAASDWDTILGLTGEARGRKGSRFLTLVKGSESEDALQELGGSAVLSIRYTGVAATCKLTVQDSLGERKLTTTCAGTPADDLSFVLGATEAGVMVPKLTVKQLIDQIDAHANYEATVLYFNPEINATDLDYYTDLQVETVAGILKRDTIDFVDWVNDYSQLAIAEKKSNIVGSIATISTPTFFTGGTDGSSIISDWSAGLDALRGERINLLVPLISEDRGSLSIDTINALAASHCIAMTSTTGKSERQAYCSKLDSKENFKLAARALNSALVSLVGQDVQVYSHTQGKLAYLDPWAYACVCAGMQAGSAVGEPITYKLINVNDVRVRDGSWDPKVDYAEMIEAGCTFAEPLDTAGFRTVVGNTTYGVDANFVWNRSSVVEAGYYVAYDLRVNLELIYTGTKARTGTAEAIANTVKARMEVYLDADIIVGDDLNEGVGYKNLSVRVEGNTGFVDVIVTPVQGIDFILPTIYLADIRQAA